MALASRRERPFNIGNARRPSELTDGLTSTPRTFTRLALQRVVDAAASIATAEVQHVEVAQVLKVPLSA